MLVEVLAEAIVKWFVCDIKLELTIKLNVSKDVPMFPSLWNPLAIHQSVEKIKLEFEKLNLPEIEIVVIFRSIVFQNMAPSIKFFLFSNNFSSKPSSLREGQYTVQ